MFTGIIEATSTVIRANESRGVKQVEIKRPKSFTELKTGDSIACDGICLTVVAFGTESFKVEIMRETAKKNHRGPLEHKHTLKPGARFAIGRQIGRPLAARPCGYNSKAVADQDRRFNPLFTL